MQQPVLLRHKHKGQMMSIMMSMRWEREKERKEKKNGATPKRVYIPILFLFRV